MLNIFAISHIIYVSELNFRRCHTEKFLVAVIRFNIDIELKTTHTDDSKPLYKQPGSDNDKNLIQPLFPTPIYFIVDGNQPAFALQKTTDTKDQKQARLSAQTHLT